MTRLSIITINYNNLEGLVRTCRSLTFIQKVSFEHVIIDGGSKDGSLDFRKVQNHRIIPVRLFQRKIVEFMMLLIKAFL